MKKLLFASLLMLSCGCMNVLNHTGTCTDTYKATKIIWDDCICVWWNGDFQFSHPVGAMVVMYTYPVWFVDLPCEAVADTLTFPWDLHNKIKFSKKYRMAHPEEFSDK